MHGVIAQYGIPAYVGRFVSTTSLEECERDAVVVVQSPRGVELATVLGIARLDNAIDPLAGGNLLRRANADDLEMQRIHDDRCVQLIDAANELIEAHQLPLISLDAEILLEGRDAVLHLLVLQECDASEMISKLNQRFNLTISLLESGNYSAANAPNPTCDKPGCGTESGGCTSCSSGGCARKEVKSADDLTTYFAGLRQQMEQQSKRLPLHG